MDLAGKYRLIAELGQGGMATVYLAVSLGTSGFRKLAVVKLIRPQYASDPDLIQMFLDEARLCARLNHPNIVQTYDVGIDDGQYLMAMEYLDGVSLHTAVARFTKTGTTFPFSLRARVLMEVLEGLRYAHELTDYDGTRLEIVHRDVTPHNIFITYDGQVKLLDFGIAKAATSSVQTATGVIKGKLTYMAPEQALCDSIDARADLYAVGVMLWEAIAGRRRWPAGLSDAAVFTRVASGELPEPPNAAAAGLPEELDAIVLKALAPKREDRYQTAAEMRAALDPVLRTIEPPATPRELGLLLQGGFAEDRKRIRQVIEDQFKAMDSGQAPPPSSVSLPTVHPPRGTDSALNEKMVEVDVPRDAAADPLFSESARKTGSTGTGITGMVTKTGERKPGSLRVPLALGAMGFVIVALATTLGTRAFSHRSDDAGSHAATAPPLPVAPPPPTAPPVTTVIIREAPAPAPPPIDSAAQALTETSRHAETNGHPNGVPGRMHPGTHGPATESAAPETSASAPPATAAPAMTEMPNTPRPPTKPKVNLERDNPWP